MRLFAYGLLRPRAIANWESSGLDRRRSSCQRQPLRDDYLFKAEQSAPVKVTVDGTATIDRAKTAPTNKEGLDQVDHHDRLAKAINLGRNTIDEDTKNL